MAISCKYCIVFSIYYHFCYCFTIIITEHEKKNFNLFWSQALRWTVCL